MIQIIERLPTPQEFNNLRQAVGWRTHREDVIEKSLANTLYATCAFADGELVGMARVIGDAGLAYYIHDVVVIPSHQGQGIGTQIMDAVIDYLRRNADPNVTIGLMAATGKEAFYERYGFIVRPNEKMGAGMIMYWPG